MHVRAQAVAGWVGRKDTCLIIAGVTQQPLLSVIVAASNQEGSLRSTVDGIDRALTDAEIAHEILVVDDHSIDGTQEVVAWLQSKYPTLRSIVSPRPSGFGNAVQAGFDEYLGDVACVAMADGSDDPNDIVAEYHKLGEGFDTAFGSRFVAGGKAVAWPLYKRLLARLGSFVIQLLFGTAYNDVPSALKCYRREAIDGVRPLVSRHRNILFELPLKSIVRGYSHSVSPLTWRHRDGTPRARGMWRRNLFSILQVLIEKLFARDDYARGDRHSAAGERSRSMLLPWLAFAFVVVVRILFIKTYPLNNLGGDTPGYYHLLCYRLSNLCHAPGYPFLAGFPLGISQFQQMALDHGAAFRRVLLLAQHGFDLFCLAIFMVVLARAFNRTTAVLAVAIAGLSLQGMGVTSSVYPEWLEGDLLLLMIAFALLAWRAKPLPTKTLWYVMAFVAFTWCYLVKFNAMIVLPVLVLLVVLERVPWKDRLRIALIAGAIAFVNYAAFVAFYHRPKTGTTALSYDHSWVLMARLAECYGRLPYPQGIATKRWLAFAAMIPQTYEGESSGPFENVNTVPEPIRRPYQGIAAELIAADEARLDEILRTHPVPARFNVGKSSIPISWFVGLKVSDELGIKVFLESVWHAPRQFIASTAKTSLATLRESTFYPIFPTTYDLPSFTEKVNQIDGSHIQLVQREDQSLPYRYSEPVIWQPGYRLFSAVVGIPLPHRLLVFLIAFSFVTALIAGIFGKWDYRTVTPLMLTALLVTLVVFSNAILEFRWKEMRFGLPMVATIIAIGCGWLLPQVARLLIRQKEEGRSFDRPSINL
jgi:dolichol-phosphate mannosyltransferase